MSNITFEAEIMCPRAVVSLFIFHRPFLSTLSFYIPLPTLLLQQLLFSLLCSFQFFCGVSADQFPIVTLFPHLVLHIPPFSPSYTLHQAK